MRSIINTYSVLFFSVLLVFTACTDEVKYSPAEKLTNQQVYFPNTLPAKQELSKDANSFDIELMRQNTSEPISVILKVEQEGDNFIIPTIANFEAGSKSTKITITYDPVKVEYEDYKSIIISLADASYETLYGDAKYAFEAGIPAPWESLGIGLYREDFMTTFYGVENVEYEVEIQKSSVTPGLFRLVNPYGEAYPYNEAGDWDDSKDYYIEINASDPEGVYIPSQSTGLAWDLGEISISSLASHRMNSGMSLDEVKELGLCGTLEGGIITFPAQALLITGTEEPVSGGWYYANDNGAFRIVMPGIVIKDYAVGITYSGRYTDNAGVDYAVGNVTLGEDVTSAKVALIEGNITNAILEGIIDGSIESTTIEESGSVSLPCPISGRYSLVAISYDDDQNKQSAFDSFNFTAGSDTDTWISLGEAKLTDGFFTMFMEGLEDYITYSVEIQQSVQNPGKFRLVNPYGEAFPANAPGDWDDTKDYYLEINATDAAGVYIDAQFVGLDWGFGGTSVYSLAGYFLNQGESLEDLKADGLCGTFSNGEITFPELTLLVSMPELQSGSWLDTNVDGEFKIVLPDAITPGGIRARNDFAGSYQKNMRNVPATLKLRNSKKFSLNSAFQMNMRIDSFR